MSERGVGCNDNNYSVYHRAKLLAPIFPWLLFTALHPFTSTGVIVPAAAVEDDSTSSNLRGVMLRRNNIETPNFRSSPMNHHRRQRQLTTTTVQNYCGIDWTDANSKCLIPCPNGDDTHTICGEDESCFADLSSCPSMIVLEGEDSGLPPPQPASLQGTASVIAGVDGGGGGFTSSYTATTETIGAAGVTPLPSTLGSTSSDITSSTTTSTLPFQIGATIPSTCPTTTTNSVNVGYYQSWAKYRSSNCNPITPSQIPVSTFGYTHLIYSFAGISNSGELEPYNGIMDEVALYEEFNSLKSSNVGVTTLIAVGGWNLDQTLFSRISSSESTRASFANSVVEFLSLYNFDGLDLDWEYPVTRQGTPEDYDNYPLLVQAIRDAMTEAAAQLGRKEYLLTMAVPINPEKLDSGFHLSELSKYVDWFHLMSYDINGSWGEVAGSNTDLEYISSTVENNILGKGVSGEQLVFGMASYGRSMVLTEPSTCATAGCPISGSTMAGCSGESGFSPYFELKETYVDTGKYQSLLINDKTASMEMILDGGIFVSLDIDQTFLLKRDYYLSKCFRGQMWWALDMIKDSPFGTTQVVSTSDTLATTQPGVDSSPSSVSAVATMTAPGVVQDNSYCADTVEPGLVPIKDCVGFAFCQNSQMVGSVTMCSPGLIFDANMEICNWPSATNVCGFEYCPNKMTGYVPFEDCTKFYYCNAGNIDGDIDVCPDGTLFDIVMGICNWAGMVVCPTPAPTSLPVPTSSPILPQTGLAGTVPNSNPILSSSGTSHPTYGAVVTNAQEYVPSSLGVSHDKDISSSLQDQNAPLRFSPTDDAYVQESQPSANYNDRFIVVDQNERFDGLIRFSVQGIEDRSVEYIKLRLFVSNESMFGGNFYKCDADWHEDVVTWDTVPSIVDDKPLAVVNAAILNEWIEVDLTGLIEGDGPVALRITSDSTDNVMYSSKENPDGNSPELIIGVEHTDLAADAEAESDLNETGTPAFKIGPTDDAFVFLTTADGNFGQHEDLMVGIGNGDKKSYLRFDLTRVDTKVVRNAKLRLYATASSQSGGTFVTADSNWSEDTITYNNAPPADGIPLGMLNNVEAGQWYELDITDAITESAPLTICILGNHEDKVMYSSKDGPHSPEITLILDETVPRLSQQSAKPKVMELSPTDDATLELQDGDMNFGTSDKLKADSNDGMRNFLLRFDATSVPRGEVKSAVLRVYAMNQEPVFGGTFVENKSTQWNERTVTWNNAPPSDGRVLGSLMEVEYGSWYNIDVTPAVIGGSAVSFRVSSPHFNSAIYGSKESEYKPQLIIQYSLPAPLPEDMIKLAPTDDTSILMEKPDENFGRSEELRVDGFSGIYNSLLRFDLSSVEKGTVEQAILRLYAIDGSPSGGTFVRTRSTDWNQHTVTWNSAPAADGQVIETLGDVTPYQWYEIDLTAVAEDLGGEALAIRIAPSHGLRCAYASSRDRLGHSPQLLIKVDMFAGME